MNMKNNFKNPAHGLTTLFPRFYALFTANYVRFGNKHTPQRTLETILTADFNHFMDIAIPLKFGCSQGVSLVKATDDHQQSLSQG